MSRLNWRRTKTHAPSKSGKYLVTIQTITKQGKETYADLAQYNGNLAKWHSVARLNGRDMMLDDITNSVIFFVDEPVETNFNNLEQALSKNQ